MNSSISRLTLTKCIFVLVIFSLLGSNNFDNSYKVSKILLTELNIKNPDQKILVWINFTDKGSNVDSRLNHPETYLTQRAIERRMKVNPPNSLVDITDIPVNSDYINVLKNSGIEIKQKSKWFNSISCYATKNQIDEIIDFDFVRRVDLVKVFRKNPADVENIPHVGAHEEDNNFNPNTSQYELNYGNSLEQMEIINAPIAHDSGYMGQGVLIASFDTGFDNLIHPVFDSIRARGIRTYDFVNHDTNVANENGQMGEGSHGTQTLSLVCGYSPGNLISPAFRSNFILAKTENTDSETPIEEDNWIAAAEWADSLGADIITSSLIYLEMDPGSIYSYDWTWMNGDSCVITIGADIAVSKGIIVCNAAGNNGFHSTHNTLGAPADADSVITVGSCNSNKNRSGFSSVGLTTDGRIKPDVVALGNGNHVAESGFGNTGYSSGSGTSFACPMTAGVCAQILSANHSLTPRQVWQVLIEKADSTFAPNRRRGWGLINAWESVKLARSQSSVSNSSTNVPKNYTLDQNYPNPFNPNTVISYSIAKQSKVGLKIHNLLGKEITSLVNLSQEPGEYSIKWGGSNYSSGVYYYSLFIDGNLIETKKMILQK